MNNVTFVRYTPPSKYDPAPRGTVCKVICDNNISTLYIQTGAENVISWLKMSDFLEGALHSLLGAPGLLEACMNLYDGKGTSTERDTVVGIISAFKKALDYL